MWPMGLLSLNQYSQSFLQIYSLIGTVSHVCDVAHGPLVYARIVFYVLYVFFNEIWNLARAT